MMQVIFYFIAMVANPIFIHTFVVFVRLYWFERRFQHIVREARVFRRTRSRSRTEPRDDPDHGVVEKGVRGRSIVVMRNRDEVQSPGNSKTEKLDPADDLTSESRTDSSTSQKEKSESGTHDNGPPAAQTPTFRREITFADEVQSPEADDSAPARLPQRLSPEEHIAFLENQRNPKDKGALRIPGPRDFELGKVPEQLNEEDDDDGGLSHQATSPTEGREGKETTNGTAMMRNVTIDAPEHPRLRTNSEALPKLSTRKSGTLDNMERAMTDEREPASAPLKARTGTFSSLRGWGSKETVHAPAPYLSWQPTIGRNSAFVDLTEEQREELGGIEYRSLKTLALVLVCKSIQNLGTCLEVLLSLCAAYFLVFHLLGVVVLLPWIIRTDTWGSVVDNDGQSRVWWYEFQCPSWQGNVLIRIRGIFTPASLFNDLGFTLTPDSMISFEQAVLPLLFGSFLIIIGNTGFPCMLRFVIYILSHIVPHDSGVWEEFKFLLDHPRRCFTLLFPTGATWWLFWILVILNGLDIIFFITLDVSLHITSCSSCFG